MPVLSPLKIGGVSTRTNLILSPMSGVTDCAFRSMVRHASGNAVGLLVSEFIAAEGLTRDNAKTRSMLRFKEVERPISIQIFGADVDRMVRAARMVEETGADLVDINCGCPAPKVVKRGGGAGLMKTPDRLRDILVGIRNAVSIPFTVKIRAGWDDDTRNAREVARMVEGEGASMLAVHGRTRVQLYRGQADWDLVGELRSSSSIPVVGSGDVTTPAAALQRLADGYADGLMIGRAAIDNPWIFGQAADLDAGRSVAEAGPEQRIAILEEFLGGLREAAEERAYLGRYRGLACRLVKGMRGGAETRQALGAASDIEAVGRVFRDFLSTSDPTLARVA